MDNPNTEKQMIHQNEFKPLKRNTVTESSKRLISKPGVIKQRNVKLNEMVKVNIDGLGSKNNPTESNHPIINESEFEINSSEIIKPIVDNGCVVGVVFNCTCGRSAEIRFEYEN